MAYKNGTVGAHAGKEGQAGQDVTVEQGTLVEETKRVYELVQAGTGRKFFEQHLVETGSLTSLPSKQQHHEGTLFATERATGIKEGIQRKAAADMCEEMRGYARYGKGGYHYVTQVQKWNLGLDMNATEVEVKELLATKQFAHFSQSKKPALAALPLTLGTTLGTMPIQRIQPPGGHHREMECAGGGARHTTKAAQKKSKKRKSDGGGTDRDSGGGGKRLTQPSEPTSTRSKRERPPPGAFDHDVAGTGSMKGISFNTKFG
jgi:hypothetical protein